MSEQKEGHDSPLSPMLIVFVCVCPYSCLTYPAGKAHAPYYVVSCGLSASNMFFITLSHKRHDLGQKRVIEHEICLMVFSQNYSATFFILRRIQHVARKGGKKTDQIVVRKCEGNKPLLRPDIDS